MSIISRFEDDHIFYRTAFYEEGRSPRSKRTGVFLEDIRTPEISDAYHNTLTIGDLLRITGATEIPIGESHTLSVLQVNQSKSGHPAYIGMIIYGRIQDLFSLEELRQTITFREAFERFLKKGRRRNMRYPREISSETYKPLLERIRNSRIIIEYTIRKS